MRSPPTSRCSAGAALSGPSQRRTKQIDRTRYAYGSVREGTCTPPPLPLSSGPSIPAPFPSLSVRPTVRKRANQSMHIEARQKVHTIPTMYYSLHNCRFALHHNPNLPAIKQSLFSLPSPPRPPLLHPFTRPPNPAPLSTPPNTLPTPPYPPSAPNHR